MEREIDRRIGAASAVMRWVGVPDRRGEEGAESKGEALDLPVNLRSHLTYGHELWGEKLSVIREELGVEPLLLRIERSQLRWLGHLFRMPPWDASLGRCSRRVPPGGGLGEDPGHAGETMSLKLAWERLGDPPGRAGGSVWGEGGLGISAQTAASMTRSRTKRMKMDGWMDRQIIVLWLMMICP
ncbi:hypothetical protein L3Q82_020839, partial [Scortum barcoo]